MRFRKEKYKKIGTFGRKHYPNCSVCGKEVEYGIEIGNQLIGTSCICMEYITFALLQKTLSDFLDTEYSKDDYEEICRIISSDCKELVEQAKNSYICFEKSNGMETVINTIVFWDRFREAYKYSKLLYENNSQREKEAIIEEITNNDVPIPIILTVQELLAWYLTSEGNFEGKTAEDAFIEIAHHVLGWMIFTGKSSRCYYDKSIDYMALLPDLDIGELRFVNIRGYKCAINVDITLADYAELWSASNKMNAAEESELRQRAILEELYIDQGINPVLIDTINCICCGLTVSTYRPVDGKAVMKMLTMLFGWNIQVEDIDE